MPTIKKNKFVDDGTGRLVIYAHIEPKTADQQLSKVEDATQKYASSNEAVATVEADPADASKFLIVWVGAGTTQITATADADLDTGEIKEISGASDLKLEEDEADTLDIVIDTPIEDAVV
jgi:hypothetical protein